MKMNSVNGVVTAPYFHPERFPSLVELRRIVRAERPQACDEFVDSIAMLAQCAYEDSENVNLASIGAFKRSHVNQTMVELACDYLTWSVEAPAKREVLR